MLDTMLQFYINYGAISAIMAGLTHFGCCLLLLLLLLLMCRLPPRPASYDGDDTKGK